MAFPLSYHRCQNQRKDLGIRNNSERFYTLSCAQLRTTTRGRALWDSCAEDDYTVFRAMSISSSKSIWFNPYRSAMGVL